MIRRQRNPFFNVLGMKFRLWSVFLAAVSWVVVPVTAAPTPVYENRGEVTMPVIDATVFLNRGTFNVASGLQPYDTQNTRHFTNFTGAVIGGSGGFQFDRVDTNGFRHRADSFVNLGTINFGGDLFSDFFFPSGETGGGFGFFPVTYNSSWIVVNASNVLNRGGMTVGPDGLVKIQGGNVNLSRSGIRAGEDPFEPIRQGSSFGLQYRNDAGITDLYWGAGMNNALDPAAPGPFDLAVLTGNPPFSGAHEVLDSTGFTNMVSLSAENVFAVTNAVSPTNWIVQAVFVNTNSMDPEFKVGVRWSRSPRVNNIPGAQMPIVQFTFEDIDTITTEPYTNYVYVLDSLGAMTNAVLATNIATRADQRPTSLLVTRVTPREWDSATTNTVPYTPDLLYNASYLSQVVTNVYAAYECMIGDLTTAFGGGGGFFGGIPELSHPTNLPARVEIESDRLDLGLSRFRTDGLLSIKAKELVGQSPYKLDAAVVNADVGLTSGSLTVSNLIQPIVRRFNGLVSIWSAVWTNQTATVGPDPNDPALQVTNTIDVRFHALIVEHNFITRQTVETYKFAAKAPHFILRDNLTLQESFAIDSPDIDLQAQVNLQQNPITPETFPTVQNFTNGVALFTSVGATLGTTERPIANFVNQGTLSASTIQLDATDFANSGQLGSFSGDTVVRARNIKVEGGMLFAAANLSITADDLKVSGGTLLSGNESVNPNTGVTNFFGGILTLDVATRLTDGGVTASNVWTTYEGVHLVRKPAEGDLLGTALISKAPRFAEVVHAWAGEDRGPGAAGYQNNMALGSLVLDGRLFSLFTFRSSTGSPAALYVDHLELLEGAALDPEGYVNIEPGFVLYFASSNVDPASMDGKFDGRLRWVQDYAGANSGQDIELSNGTTVRVNRAVLSSTVIDSDGDGIPNASDPRPLEASALRLKVGVAGDDPSQVELSWNGTPGGRYRVEYSVGLQGADWKVLTTCEHAGATVGTVRICDPLAKQGEQRFYRVVQER